MLYEVITEIPRLDRDIDHVGNRDKRPVWQKQRIRHRHRTAHDFAAWDAGADEQEIRLSTENGLEGMKWIDARTCLRKEDKIVIIVECRVQVKSQDIVEAERRCSDCTTGPARQIPIVEMPVAAVGYRTAGRIQSEELIRIRRIQNARITSYNVCYTKLLRSS